MSSIFTDYFYQLVNPVNGIKQGTISGVAKVFQVGGQGHDFKNNLTKYFFALVFGHFIL